MKLLILCLGLLPLVAQEPAKPAPTPPATEETQPPQEAQKEEAEKQEAAQPAAEQAPATAASDRLFTGTIDFGYRWRSDVAGNLDAYRTTVNLGEGVKLFNFDLSSQNSGGKFYDRLLLFGNNWGGEPNSATRLDIGKQRVYDFHFDYRNIAYFNFLPSFANPGINPGVFQTQRGYDIRRRMIDTELRFRPGTRITPYVAYSRNWGDGHGVTNFVSDGNEYPVFNRLYDKTDQYRAGVNLEFGRFHVTFEQGGTTFKDDQNVSTDDPNRGNRLTPFFGQTLLLNGLRQAYHVRGDSIFERVLATATPFSWMDVSGQFLYSRPQTDARYEALSTGNLVDLTTLQFMSSQREFAATNANQPHKSGVVNLEIRPFRRVRILESFTTDRFRTMSSTAVLDLTVATPQVLSQLTADRLEVNYNRQQVQANVDVFRWLTVRAGHRYVWGDAEVRAPETFLAPRQQADLEQNTLLFGTQVRFAQKLWINGDAEIASSDRVYFRTSLADYRKGVVRARYQLLNSLSLTANFTALTNENPNPAVRFDMRSHLSSAGFLWSPGGGRRVTILGDYTYSSLKSDLSYLEPQDLFPALSRYRENAHTGTALVDVAPVSGKYAPRFSAGGSFFTSGGSRPTSYYTPLVKLDVPLHESARVFAEWRHYGLSETLYSYEGFRAHIFMMGLRLVR
jgi:hypothetical protein